MVRFLRSCLLILILFGLSIWSGCAHSQKGSSASGTLPAVKSYHFESVKIPSQLKLNERRTFVYEAQGIKAGTLYLSGRVQLDSLVNFFTDSMLKDGWRLKSTFRYPKTLLLFEKPNMSCIIFLQENVWTTKVEVWVSPLS